MPVTLVVMAIGFLLPVRLREAARPAQRCKAFDDQLPDILIAMAASLNAGHSFNQAMETIDQGGRRAGREGVRARRERDPSRPARRTRPSSGWPSASGRRTSSSSCMAVNVQRQVGGSMAELLDGVGETVRQRQQFLRKVKALCAMGRMSAYTLSRCRSSWAARSAPSTRSYMRRCSSPSTGHMLLVIGRRARSRSAPSCSRRSSASGSDHADPRRPPHRGLGVHRPRGHVGRPQAGRGSACAAPSATAATRCARPSSPRASATGSSAPMAKRLAGVALRMTPKGNIDDVRRKLQAAGMDKITPQTFLAAKCIISGLMFALGMRCSSRARRPAPISLLIGVGGGAAFFLMPDSVPDDEAARPQGRDRLAAARRARPHDRLGRGRPRVRRARSPRSASAWTARCVEEFKIVLHEMRIGESRSKALKNMADRVDMPECATFCPLDHPGRPARHVARPHPPRAGAGHAPPPADVGRGEGHEGADQDALPDGRSSSSRRCSSWPSGRR